MKSPSGHAAGPGALSTSQGLEVGQPWQLCATGKAVERSDVR